MNLNEHTIEIPVGLDGVLKNFQLRWQEQWQESAGDLIKLFQAQPQYQIHFIRALIGSQYLLDQLLVGGMPLVEELVQTSGEATKSEQELQPYFSSLQIGDTVSFDASLRRCRQQFMRRAIWREINNLDELEGLTRELTLFAQMCIQRTLDFHYPLLVKKYGVPVGAGSNTVQPLLVLGMGKLGAVELNLSSDVDLIFCYPEAGETRGVKKNVSNQEFFTHLGRAIIKTLDAISAEGFVFRVDMRLRPYGDSGALVSNFDALENYYQTQGRDWERYAAIKARVVAATDETLLQCEGGEAASVEAGAFELMEMLHAFSYRKYLDFSAIESLREMKRLIQSDVLRKGKTDDVKLGAGGIREVEFIVQVFQLIRGGKEPDLQTPGLLNAMPHLVSLNLLPADEAQELMAAYRFLRKVEHLLQAYQDRQTQRLPDAETQRLSLAWLMGFSSWDDFLAKLNHHRERVHNHFQALIAPSDFSEMQKTPSQWQALWLEQMDEGAAVAYLRVQGLNEPEPELVWLSLENFRQADSVLAMQAIARQRLDQLLPCLLAELAEVGNAAATLERILWVLKAVVRRSAYIVLLVENPAARKQLIRLCSPSPWIAEQLAEHPSLLDELLDTRHLYSLPDIDVLRDELRRDVLRIPWDDIEGHMDALRHFRLANSLRVAACEVTGILPLMKVSDALSFIAEVILAHALAVAWQQMLVRHGRPRREDGSPCELGFIVVAYGKLGGLELGHGSDLDLVFIHDGGAQPMSEGPKEIDSNTFYIRLGQKLIHLLNTRTALGTLYEVDMRLRPSGNAGLLVSSLKAFATYQQKDAWVWEHQALVRARVVAGCPELKARFERVRAEILSQQRNRAELGQAVEEMRRKMRDQLGTPAPRRQQQFHLKQDAGGIVDIEFMVQYGVLASAHKDPALLKYTDNIRLLEGLAAVGFFSATEAEQLTQAYKTYRSTAHRLALETSAMQGSSSVPANQFAEEREAVQAIWQRLGFA